jgi:hypothetical protein
VKAAKWRGKLRQFGGLMRKEFADHGGSGVTGGRCPSETQAGIVTI